MLQKHTSILFNMWLEGNWKKLCRLWLKRRGSLMNTHYISDSTVWLLKLSRSKVALEKGQAQASRQGSTMTETARELWLFLTSFLCYFHFTCRRACFIEALSIKKVFNILLNLCSIKFCIWASYRGAWESWSLCSFPCISYRAAYSCLNFTTT